MHAVKTSGKLYTLRYYTVKEKTAFNKAFGLDYLWADTNPVSIKTGQKTSEAEACLINGENYVKLRDMARTLDFTVTWDTASSTIVLDFKSPYIQE
ncbi:MAG: hypothetical protein K0Q90_1782 [Paenibacillaceae bacterium]|nr:hypothetical protein [Paenibacillaceae bacterium]